MSNLESRGKASARMRGVTATAMQKMGWASVLLQITALQAVVLRCRVQMMCCYSRMTVAYSRMPQAMLLLQHCFGRDPCQWVTPRAHQAVSAPR